MKSKTTVTKVQKEYFEDRLRQIVRDKELEANEKYPTTIKGLELMELIDKGEVKLKSNLKEKVGRGYIRLNGYLDITDFFDLSKFEPLWERNYKKVEAIREKLQEKKMEIMDNYMFGSTGLAELIKELETMEV